MIKGGILELNRSRDNSRACKRGEGIKCDTEKKNIDRSSAMKLMPANMRPYLRL